MFVKSFGSALVLISFLVFITFGQVAFSTAAAAESDVPAFLKVGEHYKFSVGRGSQTATVLEIDESGWIKVKSKGRVFWINLSQVSAIM